MTNNVGKNITQAFSLIELLIVLAIIGLLSVTAIPVYRNYTIKGKIGTAMPVFNELLNVSIEYALNGSGFANAFNLGLSATPSATTADAGLAANLSPYIMTSTNGGVLAQDLSSGCGAKGIVKMWLNPSLLGLDSSITSFDMYCYLYNSNQVINKGCFYEYFDGSGNSGAIQDLISGGWHNANTGTSSDNNNVQTYLYNLPNWSNLSCQQ